MIVVSDTTPLNYLILVNAVEVLPQLFRDVLVPPAVLAELTHAKAPDLVRAWGKMPPAWVTVRAPQLLLASTNRLGPGESEAISLAKELGIIDILLDERQGSKIARAEGLLPLPTLAILERAAEKNLLDLEATVALLRGTSIRIAEGHLDAALLRDRVRRTR